MTTRPSVLTVCKHGRRIDFEFCEPTIGGGFYRQTVNMPMCQDCISEATLEARERLDDFHN